MPSRILREGIVSSEAVCSLGWPAEVLYRRLMSVVDDYGRYPVKLIRAGCYPLQIDKVSDSDIGKWLAQVAEAGLVRVYPAQDGKRYLQIEKFGQQVRSKSKYPAPPDDACEHLLADAKQPLTDAHLVVSVSEVVNNPPSPLPGGFVSFWNAWPQHHRKAGKPQCLRKWHGKGCEAIADRIVSAVNAAKRSAEWQKDGGAYIPAPLAWLNQERWDAPIGTVLEPVSKPEVWRPPPPMTPEEKAAANEARIRALGAVKRISA